MGAAVTLVGAILAAVAMVDMGGVVAVTAGEVVTGAAGTVVVGTDGVGMVVVAGTVVVRIGMAVLPTGGGVTHTRMDTGPMVGNSLLGGRTGNGYCPLRSRGVCCPTINPK